MQTRIRDKPEEREIKLRNYECSVCHGNCDPGELVGGKCPECLEKERLAIVTQGKAVSLLNAPWEQMKLEDFIQ